MTQSRDALGDSSRCKVPDRRTGHARLDPPTPSVGFTTPYVLLFGRPPTAVETKIGLRLLGQGDEAAWLAFCQVLLYTNEFIYF